MADDLGKNSEKKCKYCKKKVVEALQCVRCSAHYHPSCAGRVESASSSGKFVCCQSTEKSEVNKQTHSKLSEKTESEAPEMDENRLKSIIKQSFQQFLSPVESRIDQKFKNLEKSVQFMSDSFEDQKRKFENALSELQELKKENRGLKERIQVLETKFDELEVKERANNIIIDGVPLQSVDETGKIFTKILGAMNLQSKNYQCVESFRLGKRDNGPIMVKLGQVQMKKEILKRIKECKGLKLKQCGLECENNGNDKKIFLNEDLPFGKRMLFKKVREYKRENNFKAAFCTNGTIYLKKTDHDPPIKIRMESDLP